MADLITEDAVVEAATDEDHLTLKISGGNAGYPSSAEKARPWMPCSF
ncbi:MAG: hypothetical protein U5K27_02435 [Desulfotignum sp.]|nr:hypothetical protein [Desulfotignum sp.]